PDTPASAKLPRDYDAIARASITARDAVWRGDLPLLANAVNQSYAVQCGEGMSRLPGDPTARAAVLPSGLKPLAWKYCGGGFGGYAVYLFSDSAQRDAACGVPGFRPIEPYIAVGR